MPVTQVDLAAAIMMVMDENTVRPDKLILIDDSDHGCRVPDVHYEIEYMRAPRSEEEWPGVNGFWNYGAAALRGYDFVTIMNDDMTIHPHFFEMVLKAFERNKDAAVVCPRLADSITQVGGHPKKLRVLRMDKREGGAFTFRGPILEKIPPIPAELTVYFGDDWYYAWTEKMGLFWVKIMNSLIYHHGSLGIKQRNLRPRLRPERDLFEKLAKKNGLKVWWRP